MRKLQAYLNEDKDKEVIDWIDSLGIKDATLVRNALIYMYRASKGLPVNLSPYTGLGNVAPIQQQQQRVSSLEEVAQVNKSGVPDKAFEKETQNSLKGLFKINKNKKEEE